MKNNIFKSKLVCAVVTGSMILSAGVLVYADTADYTAKQNMQHKIASGYAKASDRVQLKLGNMNMSGLNTVLDKMVEEGTLTKDKADAIKKYIEQKRAERNNLTKEQREVQKGIARVNMLDQMVKDGIITKDDADAIRQKKQAMMEEMRTEKLNELVEKGIINQEQLEKINEYMKAAREERLLMHENAKGMTPSERKEYVEKIMSSRKNMLQKMVEDGVITKYQADEIRKVMPGMRSHDFKGKRQHDTKGPENQQ